MKLLATTKVIELPVWVVRAAVAVARLLPPPVPVDQLAEVGRLLTVFDDELVFEELLGRGTLREDIAEFVRSRWLIAH